MKYKVEYTKRAYKDLAVLPIKIAKKILDKIKYFRSQRDVLSYAKKLKDPKFGTYRFRIGDYRAIFDVDKKGNIKILLILTIKHRKDIYKF
jgi:mRNA interferase RelE/StbE